MEILLYIILAISGGFCLPTQAGINAQLSTVTHSSVMAAAISFAVGTIGLVAYVLVFRISWPSASSIIRIPWWMWTGGFIGAYFVASTIILAPRLGAASMVALIVGGQMFASLVFDQYGLIGYQVHPLNLWRISGAGLIVAGVALINAF
jgi:transporter family-2 protein